MNNKFKIIRNVVFILTSCSGAFALGAICYEKALNKRVDRYINLVEIAWKNIIEQGYKGTMTSDELKKLIEDEMEFIRLSWDTKGE